MADIGKMRQEINQLDRIIITSLEARFALAEKIGTEKKQCTLLIEDTQREQTILAKTEETTYPSAIKEVYLAILKQSKELQRKL